MAFSSFEAWLKRRLEELERIKKAAEEAKRG